ncbi:MAG TPA: MFS transporter [Methanomassiliicoccales archaeon]|jgi:MFS family permease
MGFGKEFSGFDRRVWTLFVTRTIDGAGFSFMYPFLAIYLHDKLHISMSAVGLILLVAAAAGAVGELIGGEIADALGRKRIMVVSIIARGLVFVAIGAYISGQVDLVFLTLLVAVNFFLGSAFEPANNAMVADVVEPGRRLKVYGLLRIGVNLGWIIGPMVGGVLASISYSWIFYCSAILCFAAGLILQIWIQESRPAPDAENITGWKGSSAIFRHGSFMFFCSMCLLVFIMGGQMTSTFPVFSKDSAGLDEFSIGIIFGITAVLVVLAQFPISHYIGRFKTSHMMAAGALVYTLGFICIGFTRDFWLLTLAMCIVTVGEMIVMPASMNLVASMSSESTRGRYMGVWGLFAGFGWSSAPFVGGVMVDVIRDQTLFWISVGIFGVLSAVGFMALSRMLTSGIDGADTRKFQDKS